ERLAFVLIEIVNGADVRLVERRGGAGFTLKPLDCNRISGELFGEELEGDRAAEFNVLRPVDDTHSAAAQNFKHPITRDSFANQGGTGDDRRTLAYGSAEPVASLGHGLDVFFAGTILSQHLPQSENVFGEI